MIARRFFRMRSFGDKVAWLLTLTSAVAVVAVSFALAVFDYDNLRRETMASLDAQTLMVAMNSGAPLAFDDQINATEALAAFRARPAVALATLYDVNGARFAGYRRDGVQAPNDAEIYPNSGWFQRWSRHMTPVVDRGQPLGRIEVVYDLHELQQHLWRSIMLSSLVSLVVVGLVYLSSLRISRILIRPIAALGNTARQVSETRDYTLRAHKFSEDELGVFTDTFNQMLEQIEKQTLDIQSSRAEALRASQLKDEFLATVSHELRTPMTPILGWAQILRRIGHRDPQILQASEVIERNARAQTRIVDDLLDMSRIISGKVRLDVQEVDLRELLGDAVETVALAAEARDISLQRDFPDAPMRTRGDPHRLQQVMWNLLSNAVKFTSSGGRIGVGLRRMNSGFEIRISDTGQGIGSDFLPYVFERFRQADSSTTRQHAGLGLGLSIVKQLVELHGGTVDAQSAGNGEGSTFVVWLPEAGTVAIPVAAPVAESADAQETPTSPKAALSGLKVLLVDDEADARELIVHVLRAAGAEVIAVDSAASAWLALSSFRPGALISDIGMPGEDGYALMRRIRALPSSAGGDIPAIALTAFVRPEDRSRSLEAGFQLHVSKPIEETELLTALGLVTGRGH